MLTMPAMAERPILGGGGGGVSSEGVSTDGRTDGQIVIPLVAPPGEAARLKKRAGNVRAGKFHNTKGTICRK